MNHTGLLIVVATMIGTGTFFQVYTSDEIFAFKPSTQTNTANTADSSDRQLESIPLSSAPRNNTQPNNQEPIAIPLLNGSNIRLQLMSSGNMTIDLADGNQLEVSKTYTDVNGTVLDLTPCFKALSTVSENTGSWPPLCYALEDWAVPELGLVHRALISP